MTCSVHAPSLSISTAILSQPRPALSSQVLLNLLGNAKEAILACHPQGGVVILRLSHVTLVVTDNGGGIHAAAMEHILEPYFSTKELGTGIGLYMSKMIIESSMHGSIRVRNLDSGAEFTIICPLKLTEQEQGG